MITQTAEYALRAIAHLAMNPDKPQTAQQIAAATHVPLPYLSKVMQSLSRAGLIQAQRGLHGGFSLLQDTAVLTVYDVVQAVDPLKRIVTCPLGLSAHGKNLCPLHRKLDDAMSLVEESFRSTTMTALLNEPTESKPLCPFPVLSDTTQPE